MLESKGRNTANLETDIYDNTEFKGDSEIVPVEKLDWYVNGNLPLITEQFKKLSDMEKPKMTVACLPSNKSKCRYKGLYPGDDYRVILSKANATSETDFINASHIDGYKGKTRYIAAQGPMPSTLNDFWLMIWQHKPSAIVMVTNVYEAGKKKCEEYWPDKTGDKMVFGEIRITAVSVLEWCSYTVTTLKVEKEGSSKQLFHCHYLAWPDHDIPDESSSFVSFSGKVTSLTSSQSGPILVHCSAGVGRTGTFIALKNLLDEAEDEGRVDVYECTRQMRLRRPCMIQTESQFVFLHKVLLQAVRTREFSCRLDRVQQKINNDALIAREFKCVEEIITGHNFRYSTADLPKNSCKNYSNSVLPCENSRVYLRQADNYINAVFVDGFTRRSQFIATQLPLKDTVTDFWSMVLDQDVCLIVQVDSNSAALYTPPVDGKSLSCGPYTVTRTGSLVSSEWCCAHIVLTSSRTDSKNSISIVMPTTSTDLNENSLKSLYTLVSQQNKKRSSTVGRIAVTCLDGAKKSGLFICAHNVLKSVESEDVVDVYNVVLTARLKRPQFVNDLNQYLQLYKLLVK